MFYVANFHCSVQGEYPPQDKSSSGSDSENYLGSPLQKRGRGQPHGRGQPRGRRARGRGRGTSRSDRARGKCVAPGPVDVNKSYDDPDTTNILPPFAPRRPPGNHFPKHTLRGTMTTALDFFRLFFTVEIMNDICTYTNDYGWNLVVGKPYYGNQQGAWSETNPAELGKLIALLIYMGLVKVSSFHRYWSTKSLYHGLWARQIMSRDRFKALMASIHIVDPGQEKDGDKLRKVADFVAQFKSKCQSLYQPTQNISIDERMVKSKHRSGIRQYIKNKPTKFGIKLWVLADSCNGYTCDFDIYAGKNGGQVIGPNGLGYDVVMRLINPLLNQGYHLFFDNFYTSVLLIKDLFGLGTPACGTTCENRRGFPLSMKNGKQWARKKARGSMRWKRDGCCLAIQWKDNKAVTILSSINNANDCTIVSRKERVGTTWSTINVKQPKVIEIYNQHMNGVDLSDQRLASNNVLRRCMRWWKTLFFHCIDIAVVNSFILFQLHRAENPDNLKRPTNYTLLDFREELVRGLAGLEEFGTPPVHRPPSRDPNCFETEHMPTFGPERKNCKVCYQTLKKEIRVFSYCSAKCCQVYLHCTAEKNCFKVWHSKDYHK